MTLLDRLNPKALLAASVLAGLTFQLLLGTSYVAAFLDPVEASAGVPVALVNLDHGALGAQFVQGLRAHDTPVEWVNLPSREAAVKGLEEKRYHGALVIPANFTEMLSTAATLSPRPATVETLANPGASTSGNLVATRVLELALEGLEREVQERALRAASPPVLPGSGVFTVEQARFIADPVRVTATTVNPVPEGGANGLAPVYLTMAAWIGGYMGAVALERFRDRTRLTPARRAVLLVGAAGAQGLLAGVALLVVGLHVPDTLLLVGLLALGTWMAYSVVSLCLDLLGLPGVVPAFALLALGLPASGAVYPVEMLPPFFRALSAYDPFTWLVEALRTALYTPRAGDLPMQAMRLAATGLAATGLSLGWAALKARRAAAALPAP